jgi:hypothetical protein
MLWEWLSFIQNTEPCVINRQAAGVRYCSTSDLLLVMMAQTYCLSKSSDLLVCGDSLADAES